MFIFQNISKNFFFVNVNGLFGKQDNDPTAGHQKICCFFSLTKSSPHKIGFKGA